MRGLQGRRIATTSPTTGSSTRAAAEHPGSPANELRAKPKHSQQSVCVCLKGAKKSVPRGDRVICFLPEKTLRKAFHLGLGKDWASSEASLLATRGTGLRQECAPSTGNAQQAQAWGGQAQTSRDTHSQALAGSHPACTAAQQTGPRPPDGWGQQTRELSTQAQPLSARGCCARGSQARLMGVQEGSSKDGGAA